MTENPRCFCGELLTRDHACGGTRPSAPILPSEPTSGETPKQYPPDCVGCGTRYVDHGEPGSHCPEFAGGFSQTEKYRAAPSAPEEPARTTEENWARLLGLNSQGDQSAGDKLQTFIAKTLSQLAALREEVERLRAAAYEREVTFMDRTNAFESGAAALREETARLTFCLDDANHVIRQWEKHFGGTLVDVKAALRSAPTRADTEAGS